jgi:sarcosine oxidase, subunit alpha
MTTEPFRLDGHPGAPLSFTFNDRAMIGRQGDTLAAALLANGVQLVGRSFKYHRPRGIVAAGVEEPNAIVAVSRGARLDTNSQATRVELSDGLEARSVNAWPSLRWDAGALLGRFGRFLPAGFYYKTFMWPGWRLFEGAIRRAAGLGVAPSEPDPDRYERSYRHCDVLVVGGGPAGLAAALAAGRAGVDVVLAEQDFMLGGSLLWEERSINGLPGRDWIETTVKELSALPNVTLLTRTSVTSYLDHNFLLAVERCREGPLAQRLWQIRAAHVVLATGAIERPLVFPDNDRPGILLASAARQYAVRYGVAVGRRIVLATNNDDAYRTAAVLRRHGISVAAIVDTRAGPAHAAGAAGAADAAGVELPGVPVYRGAALVATSGRGRVRGVVARALRGSGSWRIECDAVAMSGGWSPVVQLFAQSGGRLRYDEASATFLPAETSQPEALQPATSQLQASKSPRVAGAAAGQWGLAGSLATGFEAGLWAANASGGGPVEMLTWEVEKPPWETGHEPRQQAVPLWQVPASIAGSGKQWVDFQNDVTAGDVALAARENFHSVEHLKRYTTLGMAPDQGKTSNVNGLGILGEQTGRKPGEVGTTTFRPPFTPVSFGVIAGRDRGPLFHPPRRLPTHALQLEYNATLEDYGAWLRPSFYLRSGENREAAIAREVHAVRNAVGILDYSPLGKIEVLGPDALRFLNRMVATNLETLKVGRARYSLTLTEGGAIADDGVITRLTDHHWLMGTTSGAAEGIFSLLDEWHQREWPELDVDIVNVTTQWAVLMLSGSSARELLSRTDIDIDLAASAFSHMQVREGRIGGVPVRVSRVSFTGEVSFEVAVPAGYAASVWRQLFALGLDLGLTPVGIEALDILRLEKAFIHIGTDTDGTTTPEDVGYGSMVRNKSIDFLGRRSLALPEMTRGNRPQLVGLRPLDDERPLAVGAQLALTPNLKDRCSGLGHVTSSAWSPTLQAPLALGLLADGRGRVGQQLQAWANGRFRPVEVVQPQRYDPEGVRLSG